MSDLMRKLLIVIIITSAKKKVIPLSWLFVSVLIPVFYLFRSNNNGVEYSGGAMRYFRRDASGRGVSAATHSPAFQVHRG